MEMIRHEGERKQFPATANDRIFQVVAQFLPIGIIPKDRLSRVSTRHHMVDSAGGTKPLIFIFITVMIDAIGLGIIIPVMPGLLMELTGEGISRVAAVSGRVRQGTDHLVELHDRAGPAVGHDEGRRVRFR